MLPQQGFLEDEAHRQGILKYLPPDTADAVQRAWDGMRGRPGEEDINVQRWNRLAQQCAKVRLRCSPSQQFNMMLGTVCLCHPAAAYTVDAQSAATSPCFTQLMPIVMWRATC